MNDCELTIQKRDVMNMKPGVLIYKVYYLYGVPQAEPAPGNLLPSHFVKHSSYGLKKSEPTPLQASSYTTGLWRSSRQDFFQDICFLDSGGKAGH